MRAVTVSPRERTVDLIEIAPPHLARPTDVKVRIRDLGTFVKLWPGAVRSLITGRYPVEAHRDLLLGPACGIKNVLAFA